jgi:homoserine dehydrogenase
MSVLRVWLAGFGTVGRWVASALGAQAGQMASRYGRSVTVVGIGNARDGFIYHPDGLDLASVLAIAAGGRPITEQPGVRAWPNVIEGMRATEADLLVEVTGSPPADGEPGLTHMREALQRGIPVVTSSKWPVALHGLELAELARRRRVAFRAESTVMSGTPVLSTLTEGLAGTVPAGLRGVLNATANLILSKMADGTSYQDALAAAQRAGLAERDPAADVEGHDAVAKLMILSALVFGRQLRRDQVACQGITGVTGEQARDATAAGGRLRHVATLAFPAPDEADPVTARVQPAVLPVGDPLARIDGVTNAIVFQASPVGEITITGPGAGPQLAGQGVLADIIAVARCPARDALPSRLPGKGQVVPGSRRGTRCAQLRRGWRRGARPGGHPWLMSCRPGRATAACQASRRYFSRTRGAGFRGGSPRACCPGARRWPGRLLRDPRPGWRGRSLRVRRRRRRRGRPPRAGR